MVSKYARLEADFTFLLFSFTIVLSRKITGNGEVNAKMLFSSEVRAGTGGFQNWIRMQVH
jgi:hypothetical protein